MILCLKYLVVGGPFMEVNRLPLWTELEQKIKYRIQEVSPVQVKGLVHSL
jgi:hypothetical protein